MGFTSESEESYSEEDYGDESFESEKSSNASPKPSPKLTSLQQPTSSHWLSKHVGHEEANILGIEALDDIVASADAYIDRKSSPSKTVPSPSRISSSLPSVEPKKPDSGDNIKGMSDLDDLLAHLDQYEDPVETAPEEVIAASKASSNAPALMKWARKSKETVNVVVERDGPGVESSSMNEATGSSATSTKPDAVVGLSTTVVSTQQISEISEASSGNSKKTESPRTKLAETSNSDTLPPSSHYAKHPNIDDENDNDDDEYMNDSFHQNESLDKGVASSILAPATEQLKSSEGKIKVEQQQQHHHHHHHHHQQQHHQQQQQQQQGLKHNHSYENTLSDEMLLEILRADVKKIQGSSVEEEGFVLGKVKALPSTKGDGRIIGYTGPQVDRDIILEDEGKTDDEGNGDIVVPSRGGIEIEFEDSIPSVLPIDYSTAGSEKNRVKTSTSRRKKGALPVMEPQATTKRTRATKTTTTTSATRDKKTTANIQKVAMTNSIPTVLKSKLADDSTYNCAFQTSYVSLLSRISSSSQEYLATTKLSREEMQMENALAECVRDLFGCKDIIDVIKMGCLKKIEKGKSGP